MDYGLIGEKLEHSFSKTIHESLADYTYNITPLSKEAFTEFMEKKQFQAINVTIPYKQSVMPYLDEIDLPAAKIGAVNTIVNKNGKLKGYNTDFSGFLYLIQKNNIKIQGKKVLILGKGGASKAVIAVMEYLNAKEIITVYYKPSPNTVTYEECLKNHSDGEIIINTTPVGMYPNNHKSPIDISQYKNCKAVIDVIYNPFQSKMVIQGQNLGIQSVGGLEMLVAQAKYAVEIFLSKKIEESEIDHIYKKMLRRRSNVVLIGMPSSGKTTIGKELGVLLNKKVIDIDDEIVKKIGMSIADYFKKYGEAKFRKIETQITLEASCETGVILSTGGGCVTRPENIDAMKMNGYIIFIDRDISQLISDPSRPLSKNSHAIKEMYEKRYPLYKKYSHITITTKGDIIKTAKMIEKAYYEMINNK